MNTAVMTAATPAANPAGTARHVLGRGALRTYHFLLDQGGWWDLRELIKALELSDQAGLRKQINALHALKCIARKGTGVAGHPWRYGVTAACIVPTGEMCA